MGLADEWDCDVWGRNFSQQQGQLMAWEVGGAGEG